MPRRAKKQHQHTKHQHVDTEDGWTHVIRGPSIKMAALNDKADAAAAVQKYVDDRRFTSLDEMETDYEKHKQTLRDHPIVKVFLDYLDAELTSHPNIECSHVVCLGLGTFGTSDSSFKQLIFLEWIVELLLRRKRILEPVFVYFQDPAFSKMDTKFLTSLGYNVIPLDFSNSLATGALSDEIHCASTHFSDTMLLYAPHLEFATMFHAVMKGRPAICVGNVMTQVVDEYMVHNKQALRNPESYPAIRNVSIEEEEAKCRSLLAAYDWQPEVEIVGNDFNWYNHTGIGFRKSPSGLTID